MPKDFARFAVVAAIACIIVSCARRDEPAAPIATPTVTVSRAQAAVGSPLDVVYRFDVAADATPVEEDYLVFVHFMDAEGERMWTDDHNPPVPTRAWKPRQRVEYTRTIFVPKFPYTGPVSIEIGLYSPASGDRLALVGQDSGMRSYKAATFEMALQPDNVFVVFKDGWHETEVAEDGLEWQWSKKEGTITFRNPKRDAELFLQLDQAVPLPQPQQVQVRLGGVVLDSFAVPSGDRVLRRIPLEAAQLGTGETVEVALSVDETFIPANVPGLRSTDARELGVRVFRAYVEPK